MFLRRIVLQSFRNYPSVNLEIKSNKTFIEGSNGSGKTNLLEAIYYLSQTRSFKKADDQELINKGSKQAYIAGLFESKSEEHEIKALIEKEGRRFEIDGEKKKTAISVIGNLFCLNYDPGMVFLFKEEPAVRRKLYDETIAVIDAKYLYSLGRYKKYLKERNQALTLNYDPDVIKVLTTELIHSSYRISLLRRNFVSRIDKDVNRIFKELDGSDKEIHLSYKTNTVNHTNFEEYINAMSDKYSAYGSEEYAKKVTLIGTHRDDLEATIDGFSLGSNGSQGQNRLVTLAIKLATSELTKSVIGEYPILLLDDVFSDLDKNHLARLVKKLEKYPGQVFVTGCIKPDELENWDQIEIVDNSILRR